MAVLTIAAIGVFYCFGVFWTLRAAWLFGTAAAGAIANLPSRGGSPGESHGPDPAAPWGTLGGGLGVGSCSLRAGQPEKDQYRAVQAYDVLIIEAPNGCPDLRFRYCRDLVHH